MPSKMENETLQLKFHVTTKPSEPVFIDGITIREVLPTGELGPNIITDDFEEWEWTDD